MNGLHRGGPFQITLGLFIIATSLFVPGSSAFFLPHSNCGGCRPMPPPPLCCSMQQLQQPQQQPSGFGSQLFSSYGVGRVLQAPVTVADAYPVAPPLNPWAAHMQQTFAQHILTSQQQHQWSHNHHLYVHPAYPAAAASAIAPAAAIPPAAYQAVAASVTQATAAVGYQSSPTPPPPPPPPPPPDVSSPTSSSSSSSSNSIIGPGEAEEFFGEDQWAPEVHSPAPPDFSSQIDEDSSTVYTTDFTAEPRRPTPSGYSFTTQQQETAPPLIQVESSPPRVEISSYQRSKPTARPLSAPPPAATQAVVHFSATASAAPAAANARAPLVFSSAPAAAPSDFTSGEMRELDDLDMLLITSDETFRPVTSTNPARPLTNEERASFSSDNVSKIADGLPPDLSDVIFWPIGKDLKLLRRAIALRRRRDDEARRRRLRLHRSGDGEDGAADPSYASRKFRAESPPPAPPSSGVHGTDERVSFLASYLRRRSPATGGDSRQRRRLSQEEEDDARIRRIISGGEREWSESAVRSSRTARDLLRESILDKILAMEELLSEPDEE